VFVVKRFLQRDEDGNRVRLLVEGRASPTLTPLIQPEEVKTSPGVVKDIPLSPLID